MKRARNGHRSNLHASGSGQGQWWIWSSGRPKQASLWVSLTFSGDISRSTLHPSHQDSPSNFTKSDCSRCQSPRENSITYSPLARFGVVFFPTTISQGTSLGSYPQRRRQAPYLWRDIVLWGPPEGPTPKFTQWHIMIDFSAVQIALWQFTFG